MQNFMRNWERGCILSYLLDNAKLLCATSSILVLVLLPDRHDFVNILLLEFHQLLGRWASLDLVHADRLANNNMDGLSPRQQTELV